MDYNSVNYNPDPNIDYSSDPNLAYEYLSQSTGEPILRYGTDVPYGTQPSQLVNYVPTGASTIILWDPATMLFQLAINYGLYGGWYFYPRWYNFRSIYYSYPRNWMGFRSHIYNQYDGYVRGHGASRNMGRDFYDKYNNRHRRGTSPVLNRSARTTSPVLNRSSPLNRNSRAVSPSSSPVIRRAPSPVLNRSTQPVRSVSPVINRTRSISPSSSPTIRRPSSPILNRSAQPVRMSRSASSSPVSYRMPFMMRSSPVKLSRAPASSPRSLSRSFSPSRPSFSGTGGRR